MRTATTLVILLIASTRLDAAQKPTIPNVAPLLTKYCGDCHTGKSAEAGIDLKQLAGSPDIATRFRDWEKVTAVLKAKRMPPKDAGQPTVGERKRIIGAIEGDLRTYITRHAGDPGPVLLRRLTSAEYDYTIRDLTGLPLSYGRGFVNDAVGGEGFTNVGQAQFLQDAGLERYLEVAKKVASHAVIGAGPLTFYRDPGKTGRELAAIRRIQAIYRRHGFRSGAGEGAEPFGLEKYPRAFYVAWKYRHRAALGVPKATLAQLAKAEGVSPKFAKHIWKVLQNKRAAFPTSLVIRRWNALPKPTASSKPNKSKLLAGCRIVATEMRTWQRALAAATGDEEEAAVLTGGDLNVQPSHRFDARIDWSKGARTATVEFTLAPATAGASRKTMVLWKNSRIRFRRSNRKWMSYQPFSSALSPESRAKLAFGRHPSGRKLGKREFALQSPVQIAVQLQIPDDCIAAELRVFATLDRNDGQPTPVRCTISDGVNEGETIAATGGHSALLVDPKAKNFAAWKQGVLDFASNLPEVSHREPAPSDRDPIPALFDNTYNSTERNLFHYRIKYHRDDDFLVRHIINDATRKQLDRAWVDLLTSFEYHDAWLTFLAKKHKRDLGKRTIADVDKAWLAKLPAAPRTFLAELQSDYFAAGKQLRAAESGHLNDCLDFATKAWRRPLTVAEKTRLGAFYTTLRNKSRLDHTAAVRTMLARILVSPAFLYRLEPPAGGKGVVALSDWELASRLSYFLWSSPPDDALRQAAADGRLRDPKELAKQAGRMLADPKARRFAAEFFGQWFGFYRFDEYRGIDAKRFPEFTDELKKSMHDEAVSFFTHILRKNRPANEILFADYTFANPLLAKHYGLKRSQDFEKSPGSSSVQMRNVAQNHRGGLLRLGAVLTVTSAPLRTSPVKRGDWILRRVLGTPVPPPPPDAGSIPADDVRSDKKTVRQRLEAHRSKASCVNCHSRIDPLGFALETFDPIGRHRRTYRDGQAIDTRGTLKDGTKIAGFADLRKYLQANESHFHRTLSTKLLGYALGRAVIASDRPLIKKMMTDLRRDGRLSKIVLQVVTSRQFRYRRAE